MTCQELDWTGFALDEITAPDRRRMEEHLLTCAACGDELEAVRLTMTAMKRVPIRAMPQRISFVSDPVLEPSWWRRFLLSGPKLGFASAAMLSMAILAHGVVMRPQSASVQQIARQVPAEEIRAQVLAEVSARLTAQEKKVEERRQEDLADLRIAFDTMHKRWNNIYLSAARYGGD